MNETFFRDKTAVVTGAGGTLCSAVARDLASCGARVALLGRTFEKLDRVAAEIRAAGAMALPIAADVTDLHSVEQACAAVEKELGPCDLLVNGAGGNQAEAVTSTNEFTPDELAAHTPEGLRGFFNLDLDRFSSVIRANTLGTVIPCQVFGRAMARRGRGSIVNFASMNSFRPLTRVPAYGMAKAAVVNFTQWLAVYLAPAGIRVNAVAPGFFVNDRSRKILFDQQGSLTARGQNVMSHTPLGRFGDPADLLGCIRWLLNDEAASFVTGITVPVDGGFLASSGV
jgi:NAD(P)-dependent dehydrogenase (short-subunit alcohol dehydrogenase family)